jgi:hypothetical protein
VTLTTPVLSDTTVCTFDEPLADPLTIPAEGASFAYTCDTTAAGVTASAKLSWGGVDGVWLEDGTWLKADWASATSDFFDYAVTEINSTVTLTDTLAGIPVSDPNPFPMTISASDPVVPITYDRIFDKTKEGSYTNTATLTLEDGSKQSDNATVTVSWPKAKGGLTIGYWQNNNGQALIKNAGLDENGVCKVSAFLHEYGPFTAISSVCATAATDIYDIIKAAKGNDMPTMLKAQMLATALSSYFNGMDDTKIDLTVVPGVSGNAASVLYGDTSAKVAGLLTWASTNYKGMTDWYNKDKAKQEVAKSVFDAINNEIAYGY